MPPMARIGAHVSVAGGKRRSLDRADELGVESIQIFAKNANRWSGAALDADDVAAFRSGHASRGGNADFPAIAHASYLINLASPKAETAAKSRAALQDELERCDLLGLAGVVLHPGAHVGEGREAGLDAAARGVDEVFAALDAAGRPKLGDVAADDDPPPLLLLENTAGQGTVLGRTPAELGALVARCDAGDRLGVCLDTCHAFAAGYDLRDAEAYERFLDEVEAELGLERVRAWHLNDSVAELGANKDRHANLGEGELGLAPFERLLADVRFAAIPMILETPLGDDEQGHARDLATLRELRGD